MSIVIIILFMTSSFVFADAELERQLETWRNECANDPNLQAASEITNCIARNREQYERLRAEREAERAATAATATADATPVVAPVRTCGVEEIRNRCQRSFELAQDAFSRPADGQASVDRGLAVAACQTDCSPDAPSVVYKLDGFEDRIRTVVLQRLASQKRNCNRPGEVSALTGETVATPEPEAGARTAGTPNAEFIEPSLPGYLTEAMNMNTARDVAVRIGVATEAFKPKVQDRRTTSFGTVTKYGLFGNVQGIHFEPSHPTGSDVGSISYRDSSGGYHDTYQEALAANYPQFVPTDIGVRPRSRPVNREQPDPARTVSPDVARNPTPDPAAGAPAPAVQAPASSAPVSPTPVTANQNPQARPQQNGVVNPAGRSQAAPSNFSNPFGNSSFNLGGANAESGGSSAGVYAGTSEKTGNSQSFASEGVGGDGAGSGTSGGGSVGSNDGGGFSGGRSRARNNAPGSQDQGSPRTAAAPMGVASSAPQLVASASGVLEPQEDTRIARNDGSFESDQFQSGYHKVPERDASGRLLTPQEREQYRQRIRRQRVSHQCRGDMQCIANILGRGRMPRVRHGRGLASQSGLPDGAWQGYGDILNHMAQIHDRMPLDHEGELAD